MELSCPFFLRSSPISHRFDTSSCVMIHSSVHSSPWKKFSFLFCLILFHVVLLLGWDLVPGYFHWLVSSEAAWSSLLSCHPIFCFFLFLHFISWCNKHLLNISSSLVGLFFVFRCFIGHSPCLGVFPSQGPLVQDCLQTLSCSCVFFPLLHQNHIWTPSSQVTSLSSFSLAQ